MIWNTAIITFVSNAFFYSRDFFLVLEDLKAKKYYFFTVSQEENNF